MSPSDFSHRLAEFIDGPQAQPDRSGMSVDDREYLRSRKARVIDGEIRSALKSLPVRKAPEDLAVRLRVVASHEIARRAVRRNLRVFLTHCLHMVRLWLDNLMRPLAIPAFGGVVSAIVLFSMLIPTFSTRVLGPDDVPTVIYTAASVKSSSMAFGLSQDEVIVDLVIDDQGRMLQYSLAGGQPWGEDPALRRSLENHLLFTQFTPARMFGQPQAGRIRLSLRRSRIDVRG